MQDLEVETLEVCEIKERWYQHLLGIESIWSKGGE
jgi:hypothetical protein